MKLLLTAMLLSILSLGCVQPAYKKIIILTLRTPEQKAIKSAGVRGNDSPLERYQDMPLEPIVPDSLYQKRITMRTGFLSIEIVFAIDGNEERLTGESRRVVFSTTSDTTYYNAVFNVVDSTVYY